MNANTGIRTETKVDIGHEVSRFVLNAGIGLAALIGLWGVSCLIGGLVTNGAGGLLKGFISAVIGY